MTARNIWQAQSPAMKLVWFALAILTVVIVVHGTYTYRLNHQVAFAVGVEQRIDIDSIHVKAVSGTLVLFGRASREQSEYAEGVARQCLEKYARRVVNPPSNVRNEIEIGPVVTGQKETGSRDVANTPNAAPAPKN